MAAVEYSNNSGLSLSMAIWLATDGYVAPVDQFDGKEVISATTLLKPTRQLILGHRLPMKERVVDVSDQTAARYGHAIHDSIENAIVGNYRNAMASLGYPKAVIDRVRINPTPEDIKADSSIIPFYTEQRLYREIDGVVIAGKYDQNFNGIIEDNKSTSVYGYMNGTNSKSHSHQLSIYRWLNPDIVTEDFGRIQYIFTDWQSSMARSNPKYPNNRVIEVKVPLLSISDTERLIRNKLHEIRTNSVLPERQLVHCTEEELWRSEPKYKYYSKEESYKAGKKSSKNFDNKIQAIQHKTAKGTGIVVTVPGKVKRCNYCEAFATCSQKDAYDLT